MVKKMNFVSSGYGMSFAQYESVDIPKEVTAHLKDDLGIDEGTAISWAGSCSHWVNGVKIK